MGDCFLFAKRNASAGRVVANAHPPDSDDTVVSDAKVVKYRGVKVLHMNMDAAAFFSSHFAVYIVYITVVDIDMPIGSLRSTRQHVYAKQLPLISICPIGIRNLKAIRFPVRGIL